jgi:glycosyltransferase involved in cell wall biosynthesis
MKVLSIRKSMRFTHLLFLIYFLCIISQTSFCLAKKIVGLVQIRNESAMIEQCLHALSFYTDAIVILDDASTDDTVKICESVADKYHIEHIIKNDNSSWETRYESYKLQKLLNTGRSIKGTHFIYVDADEIFTSNCKDNNYLRNKILELTPGQNMHILFFHLWKNTWQYRDDNSKWRPNFRGCIFCDDGVSNYSDYNVVHVSKFPNPHAPSVYLTDTRYGLIHFQFVNWRNVLVKQAWYRCLERIRYRSKPIHAINSLYAPAKNEHNMILKAVPSYWLSGYSFFSTKVYDIPSIWREKQVLEWFGQYGVNYFKDLDIWDIQWGEGLK